MGSEVPPARSAPRRVLVVGAGVVGASVAWHLARGGGAEVTIVAEEVGGVATPCSFAWLNASHGNPRFYYDFRRRSMAGWKRLAEEVPALAGLVSWCGALGWDLPPDQLAAYQKQHAAWGYDIRRIERAEIEKLEPALHPADDVLPEWALHVGEEGMVEAADAARALVADAQQRGGARLVIGTVARLLLEDDGAAATAADRDGRRRRITGVVLAASATPLHADHVVIAAGVGSVALCAGAGAGVTLPLATPAPPGLLARSKPLPGGARVLRHVIYTPRGHMRQTADGRVLAGADFVGGDPGTDPAAAARACLDAVRAALRPEARAALELDGFTVGLRPQPADGLPILGGVDGVRGLHVAVMHSGVTNAPAVGEVLAESILRGRADEALVAFGLARFKGGGAAGA